MIAKIEVERFSLTSSRPFDNILAAIKAGVGHPDMVEFAKINFNESAFFCRA